MMHKNSKTGIGALFIALFFIASVLMLPGCVKNPNTNLSSSECCNQSDAIYNCRWVGNDTNGNRILSGCGQCAFIAVNNSILGNDGKPLNRTDGSLFSMADCPGNCNFKKANCTNKDGQSTCYEFNRDANGAYTDVYNESLRVAPICAPEEEDPCLQNNCTAMICGKKTPRARPKLDASGVSSLINGSNENKQDAFSKDSSNAKSGGLIGKVCEFEPMNRKTTRLLKTADWAVNNFRLGVAGTFSDYDRARFYMPQSDFYCGQASTTAVVDRFTNYVGYFPATGGYCKDVPGKRCPKKPMEFDYKTGHYYCTSKPSRRFMYSESCIGDDSFGDTEAEAFTKCKDYCEDDSIRPIDVVSPIPEFIEKKDWKYPLSLCMHNATDPDKPFYYCANDTRLVFEYSTTIPGSDILAIEACKKSCNYFRFETCQKNMKLVTKDVDVSPPDVPFGYEYSANPEILPFVDVQKYAEVYRKENNGAMESSIKLDVYPNTKGVSDETSKATAISYYKKYVTYDDLLGSGTEALLAEMNKPGPAGGKIFECEAGKDCLSGTCDTSQYSRSVCITSGGQVNCNCKQVSDCKNEFFCAQYPADSVEQKRCQQAEKICNQSKNGKKDFAPIMCWYDSVHATPDVYSMGLEKYLDMNEYKNYSTRGTNSKSSRDGIWGVLDFSEFNKFLPASFGGQKDHSMPNHIEMVNKQTYTDIKSICVKAGEDDPRKFGQIDKRCVQDGRCDTNWVLEGVCNCYYSDGTLKDWKNPEISCPSGYTLQDISAWADNSSGYAAGIRWNWDKTYEPAPEWQVVYANNMPQYNGAKGAIFTNRNTTFDDLKARMPFVKECNLEPGKWAKGQVTPAGADIVEIDPYTIAAGESVPGADNRERREKTWLIYSYGDCEMNQAGGLLVQTYGWCKPCGTVMGLAYQKVSDWDKTRATQADWELKRQNANMPWGYCPGGCSRRTGANYACEKCQSDYPSEAFSTLWEGSPSTDPEYGWVVGKVAEYQADNVMPVLDLREYSKAKNFAPGSDRSVKIEENAEFSNWQLPPEYYAYRTCMSYGGKITSSGCAQRILGFCTRYYYMCTVPGMPDWLITYLQKNHSSAITIVDNLPVDFASDTGKERIKARLGNAYKYCPDCLNALLYEPPIKVNQDGSCGMPGTASDDLVVYKSTLEKAILSFSEEAAKFRSDDFMPKEYKAPAQMEQVKVLVLKIDLSNIDPMDEKSIEDTINETANISRHVLQQAGWPTMWMLAYPEKCPGGKAWGTYENAIVYRKLFEAKRQLALNGVIGVLLQPMDYGDPKQAAIATMPMRLLPEGMGDVRRTDTPFCAAEEAASDFNSPTINFAVRKINAKEECACIACTAAEILTGQCGPAAQACEDGRACKMPLGADPTASYKCPLYCVSNTFCENRVCDDDMASQQVTCVAARESSKQQVKCCEKPRCCGPGEEPSPGGCDKAPNCEDDCGQWPNCDIKKFRMEEFADSMLLPEAPSLIAGLGKNDLCCISEESKSGDKVYYTYKGTSSVRYATEPVLYPAGGMVGADCGRDPQAQSDENIGICGGVKAYPAPISNTIWTCARSN